MNLYARMGVGGVAGAAATYLMDIVAELIYTEHIAQREREIAQKSTAEAMAEKLLCRLDLRPNDADLKKAGALLHWAFGITSGMLAGAFANGTGVRSSLIVGAGMLAFDEVGLWALRAALPSTRYPWQTNLRSFVAHATFGASLAITYETLRTLVARCDCNNC